MGSLFYAILIPLDTNHYRRLDAADNDHVECATAIIKGLSTRSTPGYLIHTSGTSILLDWKTNGFGEKLTTKVYDDLDHVDEVTNLPDEAWHRNVDKAVLDGGSMDVRTAIICPCCIYGLGTSPGKCVSWQIPQLARWTLTRGKGLMVNQGQTHWNNVHVLDLAKLYLLLVEEALKPNGGKATWGSDGYYFAENGEHVCLSLLALGCVGVMANCNADLGGYFQEDCTDL